MADLRLVSLPEQKGREAVWPARVDLDRRLENRGRMKLALVVTMGI